MRLLLTLLFCSSAAAQSVWQQRVTQASPPATAGAAMVYDSVRHIVVMFGGSTSMTWEYDGLNWSGRQTTTSPPARSVQGMAYDSLRHRVVMFGGRDGASALSDTWEYDGIDWIDLTPPTGPSARQGASMCFDGTRGRTILFGGRDAGGVFFSDTWTWDGAAWSLQDPSLNPPGRSHAAMTFDGARGEVLIFGGTTAVGTAAAKLSDTWAWNGADWQERTPSLSPSPRDGAGMAFDILRQHTVLFGGNGTVSGQALSDTWTWDGSSWQQLHPLSSPAPDRLGVTMAFDIVRRRTLIFGGPTANGQALDDTWEHYWIPVADYQPITPGCAGSASGVPVLSCRDLPVLGQSFVQEVTNAPAITSGALFFSVTPANFSLALVGAPGCIGYANGHVILPFGTDFNGVWFNPPAILIPNDPGLAGGQFWCQAFLIDHPANRLGVIVSNGATVTVGY